ncbi:MAG: 30S ribosomal protein S17 [Bacillota bacterium]|jgi:small subunit ribosomal protein S17|nr:30S ribosomal protein S17 [Bacillota bacterium]NLL26005.1 30S ribosomal protein S17 [Erysipelotrichia bacterium]
MEKRSARKVYRGVVVSDKSDKTIVVEVTTSKIVRKYGKRVKYTKKFAAHDENNVANVGDKVIIMETRPLSATKHFRLVEVVEKAQVL